MKKLIIIATLVIFFFLTTFLCLSANSIVTYEDFSNMWQQAQANLETNNPGGHSGIYTDMEMTSDDIQLSTGWIEGVGVWGLKKVSYQYYYDTVENVIKIEFTIEVAEADQVACAEVVNAEIWDTFIGVTGKTYELQEQTVLSEAQVENLANQGIIVAGEWVPVDEEGFNWFGLNVIPAIGNGYYDEDGIYIPTIVEPSSPGDNYTYYQLTLPPDLANIPPDTVFPSVGLYVLDN